MAPHSQILVAVYRNRDGEDSISQLAPKELGKLLSSQSPTIICQQVANPKMVVHLYANIGRPPRQEYAKDPSIMTYINHGPISN